MKKDEACLKGVIRISLSASITKEDIDRLISTIRNGIKEYAR
jgi:cysteine sulfinate desulfinase/cysteine desulfurase-like protein